MKTKQGSLAILLAVMLIFTAAIGLTAIRTADAQYNTTCYTAQGGAMQVAGSGCTYVFESGSRVRAQPATLAITNGTEIGSVYGVQLVSMSVNSTATITTTGYVAGDSLKFYNNSPTYTLTIEDSSPVMASGNISLAQYDWAELWFDGSYWVQTGESDN